MGDRDGDGERELRRLRRGLPDRLPFGERGGERQPEEDERWTFTPCEVSPRPERRTRQNR